MESIVNTWKNSFKDEPEYIKYEKIRKLSGEALDSFFYFAEPNIEEYGDTIRQYLNELFYNHKINIKVDICEIDGNHFFKLLFYNFSNDGKKLSKDFLDKTTIRKQEKLNMIKSISNVISSIFEVVKVGSKNFKTIIKDVNTNKTYEIIDTGVAYANTFMNDNIKNSLIVTNLFEYDGVYFVDNSVILNKNQQEVKQLLKDNKNYNYDFIQFWMLAFSISNKAEM